MQDRTWSAFRGTAIHDVPDAGAAAEVVGGPPALPGVSEPWEATPPAGAGSSGGAASPHSSVWLLLRFSRCSSSRSARRKYYIMAVQQRHRGGVDGPLNVWRCPDVTCMPAKRGTLQHA